MKRLVAGHVMQEQTGERPGRRDAQMQNRCDRYSPDLLQLFAAPEPS